MYSIDNMRIQKYPGISQPLSLQLPTTTDIAMTNSLKSCLQQNNMYEPPERVQQREFALRHLEEITKQFVRMVCQRKGLSKERAERAGGAVFTFGSYKLGVNSIDADIDTLCVVPSLVERRDFFVDMLELLKSTSCISDIMPVPDSFVPVIKFKYKDISIDLVCARLTLAEVPPNVNLQNSSLLVGLDDKCVRSINGTRVAEDIMSLVPNLETFRIALRCIKLWAERRAIYSNVLGFFGGVAWAILVARVCQLYPNATASVVVSKFFRIMTEWNWAAAPVMLRHIEDGPPLSSSLRPWNNRVNMVDRSHRMPVITPSYPSMCATHNVTASTQRIILGEFAIANDIVDQILKGEATWSHLFSPHTFFQNYKYYLQVVVSCDNYHGFLSWSGFVEAKIRLLVTKLETVPAIALVHPYVHGLKREHLCQTSEDVWAVTHGQIFTPSQTARRRKPAKIYTKTFYLGLYIRMRSDSRTLDLTRPICEFNRSIKSWPEYDNDHMGVIVENVKCSNLPEEVRNKSSSASPMSKRALSKSPSPKLQPVSAAQINDVNMSNKGIRNQHNHRSQPINTFNETVKKNVNKKPKTSNKMINKNTTENNKSSISSRSNNTNGSLLMTTSSV